MRFSDRVIDEAKRLHGLGLAWEPQPGHYVWDKDALIEKTSPFQEGVYFILDLKHFLRRAGTIHALKKSFVWLPTWHDARDILWLLGVSDAEVARLRDDPIRDPRRDAIGWLHGELPAGVSRA